MSLSICDDDHIFMPNNCAECGQVGREVHGQLYDEERNLHFCDEDCRATYIQAEAAYKVEARE
jgi:hypothetical protein